MNDRSHVHERPWLRPLVVICSDMQQSIYMSCVFLLCLGSKRHCRSPAFPYQEQYIRLGLGQPIHNLSPHLIQPLSSCLQSIPVPFVRPQISISPTTSSHICNNRDCFETFRADNFEVGGVGQSNTTPALGRGTVKILATIQGRTRTITLRDVIYCPDATQNLMSISKLDIAGGYALYKGGQVTLYAPDNSVIAIGSLRGKLYYLNVRTQQKPKPRETAHFATHKRPLTLDEWHRVFGHISIQAIQDLAKKGMVTGLRIDPKSKPSLTCTACIQGKAKHTPISKHSSGNNREKGDLTHSDLWGPARVRSLQQSLYYISFIDDATRVIRVRFLKDKTNAKIELQNYLTWLHTQLGRMPKAIRVDNGGEYINKDLRAWCAERGIEITTNAPYSHAQHGNAERPNRTLMELARAMLIEKHLPLFLWQEAVRYAAYV